MSMKNSKDTIGNRTLDLPAYGAMSQPTAPTRAPDIVILKYIKNSKISKYETARFLFLDFLTLIRLCLVFTSPLFTFTDAPLFCTQTHILIKRLAASVV
jgi:hypothetical protein